MDWYFVTKTIKGHRYVYKQRTRREGGKVRTESKYLGREDDEEWKLEARELLSASLQRVAGRVWRADTGFRLRNTSVLDVIEYEESELGNTEQSSHLSEDVRLVLGKIDSKYVVWVTRRRFDARRYGEAAKYNLGRGARLLAEDGDGGLLVLLDRWS